MVPGIPLNSSRPKTLFLKQMERYIGKGKGRNKEFYNFKLFGSSGDPIETQSTNEIDMD